MAEKPIPRFDWDDLEARAGIGRRLAARPPNSTTIEEYSQERGVSMSTATRHLAKMVRAGVLEKIEAVAPTRDGRMARQKIFVQAKRGRSAC